MLESLRAYGLQRLDETGELAAARADHLHWCIELAERVNLEARAAPTSCSWLDRLDDEHDNIRAALAYAVEHDPAAALRLVASVILPWWFRGRRQRDAALDRGQPRRRSATRRRSCGPG